MSKHTRTLLMALTLCSVGAGCLGGSHVPTQEYVLTSLRGLPAVSAAPPSMPADAVRGPGPVIGVGPVVLPAYLRRLEIVSRGDEHTIHASTTHRWGEDLAAGFARTLAEDLGLLVPTERIGAFPAPIPARRDYRVAVEVERFERGPDDSVTLEARWILSDRDGELLVERASLREPLEDGSYPATVEAMSRSISALGRQIAEVIRRREADFNERNGTNVSLPK